MENDKYLIEDIEELDDCDCCECNYNQDLNSEEIMGLISVREEEERIENFKNIFEVSDDTRNSEFYKESKIKIETLIDMVKTMVNQGIDYNNSLSICNNLIVAKDNLEQAKVQQVVTQQQQI